MGFAVYHMEKGSSSSGGIGNHIDRKEGKEHSFKHADPEKMHLNKHFGLDKVPLNQAIEDRIKEGYKGKKALRSDAVKYVTHILSGTHEDMKKIFADEKTRNKWIEANKEFIKKEFGAKNVVRFSLHLDEKTPHIHVVTVPLTEDGRLSAKEVIGNRTKMQERQDRYAEQMKEFGLERGIRSTGIEHEGAREYYARMKEANEKAKGSDLKAEKNIVGNYTSKSVKALENDFKTLKIAYLDLMSKEERSRTKSISINKNFEQEQKKHYKTIGEKSTLEKKIYDLLNSPSMLHNALKKAIEQQQQKQKNNNRGFSR